MPRMNSIAFDDAGREWKYTANGWEITEGAYDPIVQMKSKLEVVVAYRSKQSWFDLTNKSIFSNYKWNWFENRVSGSNVWGKMDGGDIDLGNPLGENSTIYGSMDSKGLGIGGGGGKLKAWADRLNRLPYFVKGFKTGTGSIKQGMKLYDHFGSKTQIELDAITKDSIFQNELIKFRLDSKDYLKHVVPPFWGGYNQPEPLPMYYPLEVQSKRKDSSSIILFYKERTDSIKKKWGIKD